MRCELDVVATWYVNVIQVPIEWWKLLIIIIMWFVPLYQASVDFQIKVSCCYKYYLFNSSKKSLSQTDPSTKVISGDLQSWNLAQRFGKSEKIKTQMVDFESCENDWISDPSSIIFSNPFFTPC